MRIGNAGIFVKDLEGAKKFFEDYFGATVLKTYNEAENNYYSYILQLDEGAWIELMTKPGIVAAAMLLFILSLGFYITPALLGGPRSTMLSSLVQNQVLSLLNWGRGGAMGVVLLVATFVLLAIAAPLMRQKHTRTRREA